MAAGSLLSGRTDSGGGRQIPPISGEEGFYSGKGDGTIKGRLFGFAIAAFLLLGAVLFVLDQNNRIDAETVNVSLAGLPDSFAGFRIVQLSDLHGKTFGENNTRLLSEIREEKLDLIAITGDLADDPAQFDAMGTLAAELTQIAPTYYVTGNHEWATRAAPALMEILEKQGVHVLRNEYTVLRRGEDRLVIAGIDDPNGPKDQKTPEELTEEIRKAEKDPFIVLLAHRNSGFDTYADCGIPLTLAGHGHGGLIRLPFTDGLIDTDRTLFPQYTNGLYTIDGCSMFVSRGLGNVGRTFRLFNRPHLPVIVLSPAA